MLKTFQTGLAIYQKHQAELAAQILLKEMRKGRIWAITDDKAAAAMWQYLRAAKEGAAANNLRMLAEALTNAATEPTFAPDEFKRHSEVIASLSREEIYVAAAILYAMKQVDTDARHHWREWTADLWKLAEPRLVPSALFAERWELDGHLAALQRTGWIVPIASYGGPITYRPTSLLDAVSRLVDWEAAAARAEAKVAD